jgi:hypothetical protein
MTGKHYYKTKSGFQKVFNEYCGSSLSIKNFCEQSKISRITFYKYKKLYNISKKEKLESNNININSVHIINDESDKIRINGFEIDTADISDDSLIRILKVIKRL